jgi:hypothetical protein
MAKNMQVKNIQQGDPEVIVTLKEGIDIKHNYKKKDQITIELKESGETYLLSTKKDLEEIYRIHLSNTNSTQVLYEWCMKSLNKI